MASIVSRPLNDILTELEGILELRMELEKNAQLQPLSSPE